VSEPVEQLSLLLGVPSHVVILGQVLDELTEPRAKLVREVRRCRPDQRVDVVAGRFAHRAERYR
jgi:hypothetical protein